MRTKLLICYATTHIVLSGVYSVLSCFNFPSKLCMDYLRYFQNMNGVTLQEHIALQSQVNKVPY